MRVFYTSVSRWFFSGFRVTANLQKSPELFLVFWAILTMLRFGWSLLVLWFLSLLDSWPNIWGLFQVHQLQLVSPSPSSSIVFFLFSSLARSKCLSFLVFFRFLFRGRPGREKPQFGKFSLFFLTITRSGLLAGICLLLFVVVFYFYYYLHEYLKPYNCKIFAFDRNIWYITVKKIIWQKREIKIQWNTGNIVMIIIIIYKWIKFLD